MDKLVKDYGWVKNGIGWTHELILDAQGIDIDYFIEKIVKMSKTLTPSLSEDIKNVEYKQDKPLTQYAVDLLGRKANGKG